MNFSIELEELARIGPVFFVKLVAALLCGGIIGFEREALGKAAGLRTCMLVCIGSTIFTAISLLLADIFGGDPTRVASQIIPGIGFLGAGVIMREFGRGITGLTTAAIVWTVAALGMMVGAGLIFTAVGVAIFVVAVTYSLRRFERRLHERRALRYHLAVSPKAEGGMPRVQSLMTIYSHGVSRITMVEGNGEPASTAVYFNFVGPDDERYDLLRLLYEIPGVDIVEVKEGRKSSE